jgi:hypothetical protein
MSIAPPLASASTFTHPLSASKTIYLYSQESNHTNDMASVLDIDQALKLAQIPDLMLPEPAVVDLEKRMSDCVRSKLPRQCIPSDAVMLIRVHLALMPNTFFSHAAGNSMAMPATSPAVFRRWAIYMYPLLRHAFPIDCTALFRACSHESHQIHVHLRINISSKGVQHRLVNEVNVVFLDIFRRAYQELADKFPHADPRKVTIVAMGQLGLQSIDHVAAQLGIHISHYDVRNRQHCDQALLMYRGMSEKPLVYATVQHESSHQQQQHQEQEQEQQSKRPRVC